jgi:hypothetical protein
MNDLRLALATTKPSRRVGVIALAAVSAFALLIGVIAFVLRDSSSVRHSSSPDSFQSPASAKSAPPVVPEDSTLDGDLARLSAAPGVRPATSRAYPSIRPASRQQPDLYASAFAAELLNQDYRTNRAALLAWVQSESTPCNEQLVVGLVPVDLRPKLAVWTVSETTDGSEPPVPSPVDWAALGTRGGVAVAKAVRVSEPAAWLDAVNDGRITDSRVAARDVEVDVTTRWQQDGQVRTAIRSITLGLTLELRPDGTGYGFVDLATLTTAAIAS